MAESVDSRGGNGQSEWPAIWVEWAERMEREQIEAEERLHAFVERMKDVKGPITLRIEK